MDITTKRLKEIIMEEIASNLTNEDQGQFLRGASGGGGDRIKSRDIQVKADGTFTAALQSKAFDGEIEASGKLDDATVAALRDANAIEAAGLSQGQEGMLGILDQIKQAYKEAGKEPAPQVAEMEQAIREQGENARDHVKSNITNYWNALLKHHQKTGDRLPHAVTSRFNYLNTYITSSDFPVNESLTKFTKKDLARIIHEEIEEATKGSLSGAAAQLDREAGVELSPEQKKQLAYLLGKRGKQFSPDPVKRNRQINYWIDLIKKRGEKNLDVTPSYIDDEDDMKAIGENIISVLTLMKEGGVVDMDGETIVTGPDGDASPLARAGARQDDLQTTMMKAAMEIQKNQPQKAYETLLRALAAAGIEDEERLPGLGDELNEMYAGYSHSRGGARGSSYSGFPPADARKLAMRLAAMSRNRSLSYGDEKALNAYVGKQKYSTSREAKEDIIKYLVGQRFGNRADYR